MTSSSRPYYFISVPCLNFPSQRVGEGSLSEGWLPTCRSKEMSGLIHTFQRLVPSCLRSVCHNKEASCLSVLKEIHYRYSREKRMTRRLFLATGPSALNTQGLPLCMHLFALMKRLSQLSVLRQVVE